MGTHRIIQTVPAKAKGETWWAYDTETCGLNATLAVLYCLVNIRTGEEHTFFDRESFRDFIESQAPAVAWAHNGNSFDIFGVATKEELYSTQKVSSGTKLFEVELNGVKYRDSTHLFPMSLAQLAKTVRMEKGITPDKFLTGDPIHRSEIDDNDIEYCLMDVRIMAAAITRFHQLYAELVERPPMLVDLPLTTASIAYKIWSHISWPEHWYWTDARKRERPIASCKGIYNEVFRQAEAGGMVRVMNCVPGEIVTGGVVSYDRNSMYPSEMRLQTFPDLRGIGSVGATMGGLMIELERENRLCTAHVRMTAGEGSYLGFPNRDSQGRRDWNQPTFEGYLCEPEIKFALEQGWTIEGVSDIVSARAIRPFVPYVDEMFARRLEMKRNGDPAEKLIKLLMNALFGRYGIKEKPMRVDGIALDELEEEADYEDLLVSGMLERQYYDGIGGQWPYVLDNREMLKTPSSQWFGFSSFILSYARANLGSAIVAAGDDALYCDTDSVHMRIAAQERFERLMPIGDELGEWDLETPEPIPKAIYWEPKAYSHFDHDMTKLLVKHKGVRVRDDQGNFKPEAGDLTKAQTHRSVVSLYEGFRRGLEPGTELVTVKKSHRFYSEP